MQPVIKWPGGKRKLLKIFSPMIDGINFNHYFEPFSGGLALALFLLPQDKPTFSDVNDELINFYSVIKNNFNEFMISVDKHELTVEYYLKLRAVDRQNGWKEALGNVERASRFFYLIKHSFNGLYRVNSKNQFNARYGDQYDMVRSPDYKFYNAKELENLSRYFNDSNSIIKCQSFEQIADDVNYHDLVFLDPPYAPISDTANFSRYSKDGFGINEHKKLKEMCDLLTDKNCYFILTNSQCNFTMDLYKEYDMAIFCGQRSIGSSQQSRIKKNEIIINNFSRFQ